MMFSSKEMVQMDSIFLVTGDLELGNSNSMICYLNNGKHQDCFTWY